MAVYTPITNVMPLASMVTGAAVSAALGDQIRDNLVALYDGWWFRAWQSTTPAALPGATSVPFEFDTLTMSQTVEDDGTVALVAGDVQIRKQGLWVLGGHWTVSGTGAVLAISVSHSDWPVGVGEAVNDSATTKTDMCCSGVANQTSTSATARLSAYSSTSATLVSSSRSPFLWGFWLGEP